MTSFFRPVWDLGFQPPKPKILCILAYLTLCFIPAFAFQVRNNDLTGGTQKSFQNSPYGNNYHSFFYDGPEAFSLMGEAQTHWVRVAAWWQEIQPQQGQFNWTYLDAVVDEANAQNLNILMDFLGVPPWANGSDPDCQIFAGGCSNPPTDPAFFTQFVTAAVNRYKTRGVKHYEIWNEPNLSIFWGGSTQEYIDEILKPGADAVHAADPTAKVVGPATVFSPNIFRNIVTQACSKIDIASVHIYNFGNTGQAMLNNAQQYVNILRDVCPGKKLWITETGFDSFQMGDAAQAREVVTAIEGVANHNVLERIFLFQWKDTPTRGWGLVRTPQFGFEKKPLFFAHRDHVIDALNLPAMTSNPMPADEQIDVSIQTNLSWAAVPGALRYKVYFGRKGSMTFRSTVTGTSYSPPAAELSYDQSYEWRIDPVNANGATHGETWQFTLQSDPGTPPGDIIQRVSAEAAFYMESVSGGSVAGFSPAGAVIRNAPQQSTDGVWFVAANYLSLPIDVFYADTAENASLVTIHVDQLTPGEDYQLFGRFATAPNFTDFDIGVRMGRTAGNLTEFNQYTNGGTVVQNLGAWVVKEFSLGQVTANANGRINLYLDDIGNQGWSPWQGLRLRRVQTGPDPLAVTDPLDRTIEIGQTAQFSVVASGGTPGYTYRWQFNPNGTGNAGFTNLNNGGGISGVTSPNLTITNASQARAGFYRCRVRDGAAPAMVATSDAARLELVQPSDLMTVLADSFNGSGSLNGRATPVGNAVWNARAALSLSNGSITPTASGAIGGVPFVPRAENGIVSVSAKVRVSSVPGDKWVGLGFSGNARGGYWTHGKIWAFIRNSGQFVVHDDGTTGPVLATGVAPSYVPNGFNSLEVQYREAPKQARVLINGTEVMAWRTISFAGEIHFAGMHIHNGAQGQTRLDDFKVAVEEEAASWFPIVTDSFAGPAGAPVHNRSTETGGKLWIAGNRVVLGNTNFVTVSQNASPMATFAYQPPSNNPPKIRVSAQINPSGAGWMAVGFSRFANHGWFADGELWAYINASGRFNVLANGTAISLSNGPKDITQFFANSYNHVALVYDPATNKASLSINGVQELAPVTVPGFTPTIQYLGFSGLSASANVSKVDDFELALSEPPSCTNPVVTSHPQNVNASPGQTVNFSVTASGPGTLNYQWQKNGSNISGATQPSLTLTNVQTSNQGLYRCRVSNTCGSVFSSAANLVVTNPPQLVYRDQFGNTSAGAQLHGRQPEVGNQTWRANAGAVLGNGFVTANGGGNGTLPFDAASQGNVTTIVKARVNPQGSSWTAIGFAEHANHGWWVDGQIWVYINPAGKYKMLADGTNISLSALGDVPNFVSGGYNQMELHYNIPQKRVSLWLNGSQVASDVPLPTSFNPVITQVGWSALAGTQNQTQVDNIEVLTQQN